MPGGEAATALLGAVTLLGVAGLMAWAIQAATDRRLSGTTGARRRRRRRLLLVGIALGLLFLGLVGVLALSLRP